MKKIQCKQKNSTNFRHSTKIYMVLVYRSICFLQLIILAPWVVVVTNHLKQPLKFQNEIQNIVLISSYSFCRILYNVFPCHKEISTNNTIFVIWRFWKVSKSNMPIVWDANIVNIGNIGMCTRGIFSVLKIECICIIMKTMNYMWKL